MNLFWLAREPDEAAPLNNDSHVVATIREGAVLLHSAMAIHLPEDEAPETMYDVYDHSQRNEYAQWMAESRANWEKGYRMVRALNKEFVTRDRKDDPDRVNHSSFTKLQPLVDLKDVIPAGPPTPPPQFMPEEYRRDDWDYVDAYRAYYRGEKHTMKGRAARWSEPREVPDFMKDVMARKFPEEYGDVYDDMG